MSRILVADPASRKALVLVLPRKRRTSFISEVKDVESWIRTPPDELIATLTP